MGRLTTCRSSRQLCCFGLSRWLHISRISHPHGKDGVRLGRRPQWAAWLHSAAGTPNDVETHESDPKIVPRNFSCPELFVPRRFFRRLQLNHTEIERPSAHQGLMPRERYRNPMEIERPCLLNQLIDCSRTPDLARSLSQNVLNQLIPF